MFAGWRVSVAFSVCRWCGVGMYATRRERFKSETGWVAAGYRVSSCRRKWHETLPSVENDRRYWIEKNGLPICDCGYWGRSGGVDAVG